MDTKQVLFVIFLVYFSLVLGITLKFIKKGVKKRLLIRSAVLPFFVLIINSRYAMKKFLEKKQNRSFIKRLSYALRAISVAVKAFPILVGLCGYDYAYEDKVLSSKKAKKRRKEIKRSAKAKQEDYFDVLKQYERTSSARFV